MSLFMKRLSMLLVCAAAIVSLWQFAAPQTASAEDYWIYGTEDGTSYWVDSDSAWKNPRSETVCCGLLKTVVNQQCVNRTRWSFGADEGYIWANGFAIYAGEQHAGNEPIHHRPELLALYHWLMQNAPTK